MGEQTTLPAKLWPGACGKKVHFPLRWYKSVCCMLAMDQFGNLEGEKTSLQPFFNFCPESLLEGILGFQKRNAYREIPWRTKDCEKASKDGHCHQNGGAAAETFRRNGT